MQDNPLSPPTDARLLSAFLAHFGLQASAEPHRLLGKVVRAFTNLPYENLTKIIKQADLGRPDAARRLPGEVLRDNVGMGTGGTCFSLTATLLCLVRSMGWRAEPILADRRYGQNTHCALVVWIQDRPHLIDPGYLIVDPIPLETSGPTTVQTAFNQLVLAPERRGEKVDLYTVSQGRQTYRLTFKTATADPGEFLKAWDDSFDWDMMRYPLVSCVRGPQQHYLRGRRYQVRSHEDVWRHEVPPEDLVRHVATQFGINPSVAVRALELLNRKGEFCG